eukprot:4988656-Amphidinium_carterae.2
MALLVHFAEEHAMVYDIRVGHALLKQCSACKRWDLSDCCLHATSIEFLTTALLELEQRGDGQRKS